MVIVSREMLTLLRSPHNKVNAEEFVNICQLYNKALIFIFCRLESARIMSPSQHYMLQYKKMPTHFLLPL